MSLTNSLASIRIFFGCKCASGSSIIRKVFGLARYLRYKNIGASSETVEDDLNRGISVFLKLYLMVGE